MGNRIVERIAPPPMPPFDLGSLPEGPNGYRLLSHILIDMQGNIGFIPECGRGWPPRRLHEKALLEALRSFMDMPYPGDAGAGQVVMPDGSMPPN